jgi:hypothetical protein
MAMRLSQPASSNSFGMLLKHADSILPVSLW